MILKISTVSEILMFSDICSTYPGDIDVISENTILNAKSFMGLLTPDFSNPIEVKVHRKNKNFNSYEDIIRKLKPYVLT